MATADRWREVVWRTDILPRATRKALDVLSGQTWLRRSRWYLAGGTALALYDGHRSSVDLDFFTPQSSFSAAKLTGHFASRIWRTDRLGEGTVYGALHAAKVSFIAYPFFRPGCSFHWYGAVRVLDPRDIAVMKIVAISQRGRKRDFIDLYWYCQHREPLEAILERLPPQYPTVAHDYHHVLKALTYFTDAESDPMPRRWFSASWKEVKQYFEQEVPRVARDLLGLR